MKIEFVFNIKKNNIEILEITIKAQHRLCGYPNWIRGQHDIDLSSMLQVKQKFQMCFAKKNHQLLLRLALILKDDTMIFFLILLASRR